MRFLPYLLVLAMGAPVFVWLIINNLVIKGNATRFDNGDMVVLASLGAFMLIAFFALSTWIHKVYNQTKG